MAENGEIKFVTYKWLLASIISAMGLTLTITFFMINSFTSALDKKLDKEMYNVQHYSLCDDVTEIKNQVNANAGVMDNIRVNQELVLRALKIPPVK